MLRVVLSLVFTSVCFAASTTKHHHSHASHGSRPPNSPKPSHEPDIKHRYAFRYDHTTHIMAMRVGLDCYLLALDGQQQMDVHTSHGLVAIEKMMIDKLDTGAQTSSVSHDGLSKVLAHMCSSNNTVSQFA